MGAVMSPEIKPMPSLGIRTRVLGFVAGLLMIMVIVLASAIYAQVSRTESDSWRVRQAEAAQVSTERVNTFLTSAESVLGLASRLDAQENLSSLLGELLNDNPAILELVVVDERGQTLGNAERADALIGSQFSVIQSTWFSRALNAEPRTFYISPLLLSTDIDPYLLISTPTTGGGVAAARLSMTVFSSIVSRMTFGQTGNAFVVDGDGFVLAHTDPEVVSVNTSLRDRPEFSPERLNLADSTNYFNFRGIPVFGRASVVAQTDWAIFTEVEQSEVAQATQTTLLVLVASALILFVGALLGISEVLRRYVFNPLDALRAGAERVSAGNLKMQVTVERADEIGQLTTSFNGMVTNLGERATERERLIRDLQVARRIAEENSRLKSEFLSMMSHELRTPMNAIEGFVSIILNRMGGTDYNEKTGHYLTRVQANSKRLLGLINDFLDLSRVESGRLELANQPFDPALLAERWRAEVGVLAEEKGLSFDLVIDPELPRTIDGDDEAISKIVINLLGNAIKFTQRGGIALKLAKADGHWQITVSDTGIGIPPHAREYIFEEFRQADQTSRRKFGGTGLGLAIVQKYARSMGGTVVLKSEVGQGSQFIVTLPLQPAEAEV